MKLRERSAIFGARKVWESEREAAVDRRAVVTGIGAVSPNGIGREAFWTATWQGKSGIRRIKSFDPAALPVHIAGEVLDFDPLRYISEKDAGHVSRVVPL